MRLDSNLLATIEFDKTTKTRQLGSILSPEIDGSMLERGRNSEIQSTF